MSIKTIIETVKQIHEQDIVFVKMGKFYQAYGKDDYIISYLFDYKLQNKENLNSVGFPRVSINKVIATLENKKLII